MNSSTFPAFVRHRHRWLPLFIGSKGGAYVLSNNNNQEKEYVKSFPSSIQDENKQVGIDLWSENEEDKTKHHEFQKPPWQAASCSENPECFEGSLTIGQVQQPEFFVSNSFEKTTSSTLFCLSSLSNRLCFNALPSVKDYDAWLYWDNHIYGAVSTNRLKIVLFQPPLEKRMLEQKEQKVLPFVNVVEKDKAKEWVQKAIRNVSEQYITDTSIVQPFAYDAHLVFVLDAKHQGDYMRQVVKCLGKKMKYMMQHPHGHEKNTWVWRIGDGKAMIKIPWGKDDKRIPILVEKEHKQPWLIRIQGVWMKIDKHDLKDLSSHYFYTIDQDHLDITKLVQAQIKPWDAVKVEAWLKTAKPYHLSTLPFTSSFTFPPVTLPDPIENPTLRQRQESTWWQ